MTATPAYGRDYKSKKEVLTDWEAGKDFILQPQGCYINKQDAAGQTVILRYNRNTKLCVAKG